MGAAQGKVCLFVCRLGGRWVPRPPWTNVWRQTFRGQRLHVNSSTQRVWSPNLDGHEESRRTSCQCILTRTWKFEPWSKIAWDRISEFLPRPHSIALDKESWNSSPPPPKENIRDIWSAPWILMHSSTFNVQGGQTRVRTLGEGQWNFNGQREVPLNTSSCHSQNNNPISDPGWIKRVENWKLDFHESVPVCFHKRFSN